MISARFDDLTPGRERSFRLTRPIGVLEAHHPSEVPDVLAAAEAAATRGTWVAGFVGYEAAPGLDPDLTVRGRTRTVRTPELPLAWFGLFTGRETASLPSPDGSPAPSSPDGWRPSVVRAVYDAAVDRIRRSIAAGETYQVNLTLRLRTELEEDPVDVYRALCLAQRGGYAAHLVTDGHHVLSASPELFLRIDGSRITTRPMKGTAPRGRWLEEDEAISERLVSSPKERAENAMIVDLLRNDLGRIAVPGGVAWDELFHIERYETVWQLTSTIGAELRPGTSLVDVFRALFPSGSVTGAPKVATMRIIAELEDSPRGVYCGAIGYLSPPASGEPRANFNVAIRTIVLDEASGVAEYGVGGGITFDSSAEEEYAEVLAKARVLTAVRPSFALLETLRWGAGRGFAHLDEHLGRLASSASYFGFRFDDAATRRELAEAMQGLDAARVRLTLARDGVVRVEAEALSEPPPGPVPVAFAEEPVDPSDVWLFHKTTLREPYERRRALRPDVEDVILVNTRGEATESTTANLAVLIDGAWATPPRSAGLLAGTYREILLREGRLRERPVGVEELRSSPGVALVSSLRGWRDAVVVP